MIWSLKSGVAVLLTILQNFVGCQVYDLIRPGFIANDFIQTSIVAAWRP